VTSVEVALGLPIRGTFHYRVGAEHASQVTRGSIVVVPFGRRLETAYVLALCDPPADAPAELKLISEVLEPGAAIPDDLFALATFVADYYVASLGEVLRTALPATRARTRRLVTISDLARRALAGEAMVESADRRLLEILAERGPLTVTAIGRAVTGVDVRRRVRALETRAWVTIANDARPAARVRHRRALSLVQPVEEALAAVAEGRSPIARAVVELLAGADGPLAWERVRAATRATPAHVRRLEEAGIVAATETERSRDLDGAPPGRQRLSAFELTAEQQSAAAAVVGAVDEGGFRPFLLHGVTGAGKSLVYLRCIEEVVARGRSAMLLVPEIALTVVLERELRGRFGDTVAVLHSALAAGERYDAWRRLRSGAARIVFGARSAVFAPVRDLGLIIVDEEHDGSYKQDDRPRHNARDVAVARANQLSIPVLLGSATPSLESFRNAEAGRYRLLELPDRVAGQSLPEVEIIDLRDEFERAGRQVILSERLIDEMARRRRAGEQTVLLLNRRGYASFLLCRECGNRTECPNCSVCLTYHKSAGRLRCHHCDHSAPPPEACPGCKGRFLHLVGHGTEKIEATVREVLPDARVARLDRDAARSRRAVSDVLSSFERGEIDVLVGTQMVAKGHDFPGVTLVGVISVDAMLALPDFRSTERAFSLLTQVAGRAGRGDRPGLVLLQTHHPDNEAVRLACAHDYASFYRREIRLRRLLGYPPTAHVVNLIVRHADRDRAGREARAIGRELAAIGDPAVELRGPAFAPVARLKGAYRAQILMKSRSRRALRQVLNRATDKLQVPIERGLLDIDVDPQDLM